MTPLTPTHSAQYCLLAALLLHALPHDGTYVAVAGLFLAMKVQPPQSADCLLLHLPISQVGPLFGVPVDLFSPLENKVRRTHCSVYYLNVVTSAHLAEKKPLLLQCSVCQAS